MGTFVSSSFSPFQTKLGAMVYDSGYRQLFRLLGYPGCEKEAEEVVSILASENERAMQLLDVSCGPGTRPRAPRPQDRGRGAAGGGAPALTARPLYTKA